MQSKTQGRFQTQDKVELFERRWGAEGKPKACVAVVHGYADHSERYSWLASQLTAQGYNVFALDLRGHGNSGGARAFIPSFDCFLDDVHCYLKHIGPDIGALPLFLFGHSMGGLIVALYAATRKPEVRGLILSSPLLKVSDSVSPFLQRISGIVGALLPRLAVLPLDTEAISKDPQAVRAYLNDPLVYHGKICARTGAEMMRAAKLIQARMEEVTLPFLVLHGAADRLCDVNGSRQLEARAPSADKTLREYAQGYHELFNDVEREAFASEILQWLDARSSFTA